MSETFGLPREATIQLSDVFGPAGIGEVSAVAPPHDFDADITAQVRNTGRFSDGQYAISDAHFFADYGIVTIDDLRRRQLEQAQTILDELGVERFAELTPPQQAEIHPDSLVRLQALGSALVVVANNAPRTAEHQANGRNGNDFYVATTANKLEVYAQAHLLSGLDARRRITSLRRIPEGVVWEPGEQFRSSVVSDARRQPGKLEAISRDGSWPIPPIADGLRVKFVDKFSNVRLETPDIGVHDKLLREARRVDLVLKGEGAQKDQLCIEGIRTDVAQLTHLGERQFGIYPNVADGQATDGPAYLEFVRLVGDCNGGTNARAYHVLTERLDNLLGRHVPLSYLGRLAFDIVPSFVQNT